MREVCGGVRGSYGLMESGIEVVDGLAPDDSHHPNQMRKKMTSDGPKPRQKPFPSA
jgi:hypothetical protein